MSKKTPKGAKVTRMITFKLTDEEKAQRGLEAAKMHKQYEKLAVEKKGVVDTYSARLKTIDSKMITLLDGIHTGTEKRETECTEVKNFDRKKVEYWFEGEIREERDLTEADRQLDLNNAKKDWQKTEGLKTTDESGLKDQKRMDIARTFKEETGKNTSRSAVNGPV